MKNGVINPWDGELTFIGKVLGELPVDVHLGKLLVLGYVFGCLEECLVISKCYLKPLYKPANNSQSSVKRPTNFGFWRAKAWPGLSLSLPFFLFWPTRLVFWPAKPGPSPVTWPPYSQKLFAGLLYPWSPVTAHLHNYVVLEPLETFMSFKDSFDIQLKCAAGRLFKSCLNDHESAKQVGEKWKTHDV